MIRINIVLIVTACMLLPVLTAPSDVFPWTDISVDDADIVSLAKETLEAVDMKWPEVTKRYRAEKKFEPLVLGYLHRVWFTASSVIGDYDCFGEQGVEWFQKKLVSFKCVLLTTSGKYDKQKNSTTTSTTERNDDRVNVTTSAPSVPTVAN